MKFNELNTATTKTFLHVTFTVTQQLITLLETLDFAGNEKWINTFWNDLQIRIYNPAQFLADEQYFFKFQEHYRPDGKISKRIIFGSFGNIQEAEPIEFDTFFNNLFVLANITCETAQQKIIAAFRGIELEIDGEKSKS